jgi:hypothetical protein
MKKVREGKEEERGGVEKTERRHPSEICAGR